jgi:hypothetical protein
MFTPVLTFGIYQFGFYEDALEQQLYATIIVQP